MVQVTCQGLFNPQLQLEYRCSGLGWWSVYVINGNRVKEQGRYWEGVKRHLRKHGFGGNRTEPALTNSAYQKIVMEWVRVKAEGMRGQENKVKVVFWQIREERSK